MTREVVIATATIELEALLKWAGLARTGGEAKLRIQGGEIRVNGAPERRRGRLLRPGDRITAADGGTVVVVRSKS